MLRDARYAIRLLLRRPVFAVSAILTLAFCIGANTAIYTVVDRLLLRPLPYPEPDRLVEVVTQFWRGDIGFGQTGGTWEVLRHGVAALDLATTSGGFGSTGVNLVVGDHPEYVRQQRVSAGYFHARRRAGARPGIHRRRGSSGRTGCSGTQSRAVAAAVQPRPERDRRPIDHASRRAAHDRRRDAGAIHDRQSGGCLDASPPVPHVRRRRAER